VAAPAARAPRSIDAPARRSQTQNVPESLHRLASWVLAIGVGAAGAILLVGMIRLLLTGGAPDIGAIRFVPGQFLGSLGAGSPYAILWLGLLVLVLTPFTRVLLSVVLYARQRDIAFTVMTGFVLAILIGSIFAGVNP
jgi:uncharacterized membrane protein